MSPVERRTLIFNRLQTEGKVNLNQIAAELGVSSMTIRLVPVMPLILAAFS